MGCRVLCAVRVLSCFRIFFFLTFSCFLFRTWVEGVVEDFVFFVDGEGDGVGVEVAGELGH